MILVVSHRDDPHAAAVLDHLAARRSEAVLLDLSDLPDRATLTIGYGNGDGGLELRRDGEAPMDLGLVECVWWRRPQVAEPSTIVDPDVRLFTANEWQEGVNGLWQLLDARWVNHPVRDEVAARKPYQLKVAAEVGLRIPRTLITSDPARAARFIREEGVGRTVYKTFSCTHEIWRETRLVGEEELAQLDSVRLAPVIFQEYVDDGVDLRITAIGRRLFPAAIDPRETDYPVDFRMSLGQAHVEPTTLPADVEARLLELMERLGLVYGAIDMRRTPDGEHFFLEVNTAGEFLFVEERTAQPISRALAEQLAGVD